VLAGGALWARPARRHIPRGVGWWLVVMVAVDRGRVGRRASLGLAVAVGAALAALDPGDRLAGVLPGGPLGWLARRRPNCSPRVGELVAAAVVLDGGGALSPGPPSPGALRDRAEFLAEVGGRLVLGGQAAGAALPGQLPDDLAVGGAEGGVGFQPAGPALLLAAQGQFVVVGAIGLLAASSAGARTAEGGSPRRRWRSIPRPWRWGSLLVVNCSRAWSASARRALARASSRARSRGAWSSRLRSRSRSARSSRVGSRRRSRLLWVSIAKVWSPARASAWASWS
jgi:hypothetical protein